MKRWISLSIALLLCLLTACSTPQSEADPNPTPQQETPAQDPTPQPEPTGSVSPYTGLPIAEDLLSNRPVAVMVNNLAPAQAVQTGLNRADLVYEANVEGGITRLMAVFQDAGSVGQIGTVRSARYPYVDLAYALNAIYVHCGNDNVYCLPHMQELGVTDFDLAKGGPGKYGFREKNGLATEHTLYTTGEKVIAGCKALSFETQMKPAESWTAFRSEAVAETPAGGSCTKLEVTFSKNYRTGFRYDAATQRYARYFREEARKDYKTGEAVTVKNVFVLFTTVQPYSDNYHMEVKLQGGTGYYVSQGGHEEIRWSKGKAADPLVFTKKDGSTFTANAGNSWICLVNTGNSVTLG